MSEQRPNVVFLSADALRYDHTQLGGYERPTTPTLKRLQRDAIFCPNTFTLGPFTQSACIQMLTSTRPFSYGGFDHGAWGRPNTIFRQFQDAGYNTTAVSTLHWVNRFMGYGDGLDEECQLFVINSLVGTCIGNIRNSLSMYHEGRMAPDEMLSTVEPVLRKFLSDAGEYCHLRLSDHDDLKSRYPNSLIVNNRYDYRRVLKVIERHRLELENNPIAYVRRRLGVLPETHEWIAADWKYCLEPGKIFSEAIFQISNRLLALINPQSATNRSQRFKQYVSAQEIANKVISKMAEQDEDQPFFIWAHFMDTHLPYMSGAGKNWYKQTPDILEHLGYSRGIPPNGSRDKYPDHPDEWLIYRALYDAAIFTVDHEIGRIVEAISKSGRAENTIVVVCSDHGEEFGEHGNYAHQFMFYDHNTRVPLLFHRAGLGQQTEQSLVTLMDIGPTLADMCGVRPHPDWQGNPVGSEPLSGRDHVLMETFYGGNCLFEHRPLYFGVRTHSHKYLWKSSRDDRDKFSPDIPELYDLEKDPGENKNIYAPQHPLVAKFNRIIATRMAEIPEIPQDRINQAFDSDITEGAQ